MKGVIFNVLEDMVVEKLGMQVWNDLLQQHAPADRVYVSAKNYDENELFAIANGVALILKLPLQDVVKAFGCYLFSGLAERHQAVIQQFSDFTSLVMGIHNVIHVEVNKLYHDPSLPSISCESKKPNQLILRYVSPRKLCFCAEGLLFGAAEYFDESISISHDVCMHNGADSCVLTITRHDD